MDAKAMIEKAKQVYQISMNISEADKKSKEPEPPEKEPEAVLQASELLAAYFQGLKLEKVELGQELDKVLTLVRGHVMTALKAVNKKKDGGEDKAEK